MKKYSFKKSFICFILLFSLLQSFQQTTSAASVIEKRVNATILNVRAEPGTKHKIVGKVKKNQRVKVIATKNDWSKITAGKLTGWASTKYLSYITWTGYVTVDNLAVRKSSSANSKSLAKIKKGTSLTVKNSSGNSLQIYEKNKKVTGWVTASAVSKTKPKVPTKTNATNLGIYYVTANSLNVRASNNTSAKKLFALKKNSAIRLLEKKNGWGKIRAANGRSGWVSITYLSKTKPTTSSTNKAKDLGTYYVTSSTLNIRASNSSSGKIVSTLNKHAAVKLLEKKSGWGKVKTANGKTGWVSTNYIYPKKIPTITTKLKNKTASTFTYNAKLSYFLIKDTTLFESGATSGKALATLRAGEKATILSSSQNWVKIKTSSKKTGWVSSNVLVGRDKKIKSLKNKVIVLDAGHGGKDPGASGSTTIEKMLNLETVSKIVPLLEKEGAIVILTRNEDFYLTLQERVDLSHLYDADAFISVHYNTASSKSANGIMTFYNTKKNSKSASLANYVQTELIKTTKLKNQGSRSNSFYVIKNNKKPAILLELGFISNPSEEKKVSTISYQQNAANGVVNGLKKYFKH